MAKLFAVEIREKNQLVFKHSISSLTVSIEGKGSTTILTGFMPGAYNLQPGMVRAKCFDGKQHFFAVNGGDLTVIRTGVLIESPQVETPDEIDAEGAKLDYDYATSILASPDTPARKVVRIKQIQQWAVARLEAVRKAKETAEKDKKEDDESSAHPLRLSEHLAEDLIVMHLEGKDRWEAIEALVTKMADHLKMSDDRREKLLNKVLSRERMMSTAIGGQVAIPHCSSRSVDGVLMAMGISKKGIDFKSLDNMPVKVVILAAIRESKFDTYVKTLGGIARLFHHREFFNSVVACDTASELMETISQGEKELWDF